MGSGSSPNFERVRRVVGSEKPDQMMARLRENLLGSSGPAARRVDVETEDFAFP
jgi:hypothetical protein